MISRRENPSFRFVTSNNPLLDCVGAQAKQLNFAPCEVPLGVSANDREIGSRVKNPNSHHLDVSSQLRFVSLHIVKLTFVTLCFCFRIGDANLERCLHSTFQKEYYDAVRKSYLCIIHAVKL
jgi:hypothetical protein